MSGLASGIAQEAGAHSCLRSATSRFSAVGVPVQPLVHRVRSQAARAFMRRFYATKALVCPLDIRQAWSVSKPVCVVCGIGPNNGASIARRFSAEGYRVALLSRKTEYATGLADELGDAKAYACDVSDEAAVQAAFSAVKQDLGPVDVLVFNAGSGSWGNIEEISAADFERGWRINALGAFLTSKQVIADMVEKAAGSIIFVGATASLRGKPFTTGFAPAKAAQRSLAQAMARHLGPKGVHVALMIIDGRIARPSGEEIKALDPDDIASTAYYLTTQNKSAWTFELDLRPHSESW